MSRRFVKILLICGAVLLLLTGVALILRVTNIRTEGNSYYSQEDLEELIFTGPLSRSPLVILIDNQRGRGAIPFVEKYSVKLTGPTSVQIRVWEKSMAGYISFLGSNLYFDWDGLVIESSRELYPNIPRVTGLNADQVVLGRTLPTEGDIRTSGLLQVSQFLAEETVQWENREVPLNTIIDRIHFDGNQDIYCCIGELTVKLGDAGGIEEKLARMKAILPEIGDRAGILHLESDQGAEQDQSYWFEKQ